MTIIKAIPTLYRGVKFRSQLEARWAVFFDGLGLKWRYESQAFNLPVVGGYLPDFMLMGTQGSVFAEVKPSSKSDLSKPLALSVAGHTVVLLLGPPAVQQECFLPGGVREACTLTGEKSYSPVYHPQTQTRGGVTIVGIHTPAKAGVSVHAARTAKFESAPL